MGNMEGCCGYVPKDKETMMVAPCTISEQKSGTRTVRKSTKSSKSVRESEVIMKEEIPQKEVPIEITKELTKADK